MINYINNKFDYISSTQFKGDIYLKRDGLIDMDLIKLYKKQVLLILDFMIYDIVQSIIFVSLVMITLASKKYLDTKLILHSRDII